MSPCRVPGCDRRVRRLGLCFGHLRKGESGDVAPRISGSLRDDLGRKHCRTCDQWLPVDRFSRDVHGKDGLRSLCLSCHSENRRVAKYGVPVGWYHATLCDQGGCCAICRSPEPKGRGWAIDHDHACCPDKGSSCGKCVRGILCSPCNLALGLLGDDPERLRAAMDYLSERMSIVRGV